MLSCVFTLSSKDIIIGAPINVAVVIMNDSTVEEMAETCRYYNLTEVEPENDFRVFVHPDGSKLRFKTQDSENGSLQLVEVYTNYKDQQIEKILESIGFEKTSNGFVRGNRYESYICYCELTSKRPRIITISKIKNPKY